MAFLGMKGTGQFAANERPQTWREGILWEYPNGVAPLTAILSMMTSEKITDYHMHWWTKKLSARTAATTGIYLDAALTTTYDATAPALGIGSYIFIKMSEADANTFRPTVVIQIRKQSDTAIKGYGIVSQVVTNGANSYLAVKVLQAIPAAGISAADFIRMIGNANAQGAARPQSLLSTPTPYENLTQIFRNPLSLTRTAIQTKLRTADSRKQARKEALQDHALDMEQAFLDGFMLETTGENGQPLTFTRGIIQSIEEYAPANVSDFIKSGGISGDKWVAKGEDWLDGQLEIINRFGNTEKLGLCGSGALAGLDKLAKATGRLNLNARQTDYGLQIVEWVLPSGILYLMSDPIFTRDVTRRNSICIVEPENLIFSYVQDTVFKGDIEYDNNEATDLGVDGMEEEFLTEAGIEMHFPDHFGFLENVGVDIP